MLKKTTSILISLALIFLTTSCSKKKGKSYLKGKKFITLMSESYVIKPDKSLSDIKISLRKASKVTNWTNSNFNIVANKIDNILIPDLDLNKSASYSVYRNKDIPGSSYTPVIKDNLLYIVDNENTVHAFNLISKKKAWSKLLINKYKTGSFAGGGIDIYKDTLIVTYGSNNVVALDIKNGDIKWQYSLSNVSRATPISYNGKTYVLGIDNTFYCFDIKNGTPQWSLPGASENLSFYGSASASISNNKIIVPHSSGQVLLANASNGKVLWDINLIKTQSNATSFYLNDIDTTPMVDDGVVYIGTYNGTFFAVDLETGAIKWVDENTGGGKYVWTDEEWIFTINKHSQLVAMYKLDGAVKWVLDLEANSSKTKKDESTSFNGPILINSKLYISSSSGELFEVDAKNGKLLNTYSIPKGIYTPPIVSGDKIFLFKNSGKLTIIN
jgi:outer membrane protein assembly factor BamB